ncbi:MAG TPA: NAD(P)H-binding protein [Solirubrobacter sp.]|nr:NAD(P)H-binding protein [Solirubrobacter sp.]
MHVFLAGATGAIGRRLLPRLIEAGHEVTAMTRRPEAVDALRAQGAKPVVADAYDREAVFAAVQGAEVVMHQLTDLSDRDLDANARLRVAGTRNLVDAALAAGVRRMVSQSIAFAYAAGEGRADEDRPLDLERWGAVAALEAATAELPEWVVLRYGLFYGPGTWYDSAPADADSFVHVDDAAAAAVKALEWPSGIYNICDDASPGADNRRARALGW